MDIIVSNGEIDKKEVVSRINQKQESLGGLLDAEVAALLVAHELGCDVGPLFDDVYGRVSGMSV